MFSFTRFEYQSDVYGMGNYSFIYSGPILYAVDWKKVGFYSYACFGGGL